MAKYPQIERKMVKNGFGNTPETDTAQTIAANKSFKNNGTLITGVQGFNKARRSGKISNHSTVWAFVGFVDKTRYADAYEYDANAGGGVGLVVLKAGYKINSKDVPEKVVKTTSKKA